MQQNLSIAHWHEYIRENLRRIATYSSNMHRSILLFISHLQEVIRAN